MCEFAPLSEWHNAAASARNERIHDGILGHGAEHGCADASIETADTFGDQRATETLPWPKTRLCLLAHLRSVV